MGMNKWTIVACVVVATLGLLTVILGIAGTASAAQSLVRKQQGHKVSCEYQASPAVGCGVMAALLALTTQIVASAATVCCGCCRSWGIPTEAKRIVAVVLSTFSWILSIIVVALFMAAAIVSTGGDDQPNGSGKCVSSGTGAFAAATILFIITVVFQIASYVLLETTTVVGSEKPLAQESGIPMGQPATEPLDSADQKAAVGGDPPPSLPAAAVQDSVDHPSPSAPAASAKANVDHPLPSVPTVSPKASGDLTSHV